MRGSKLECDSDPGCQWDGLADHGEISTSYWHLLQQLEVMVLLLCHRRIASCSIDGRRTPSLEPLLRTACSGAGPWQWFVHILRAPRLIDAHGHGFSRCS